METRGPLLLLLICCLGWSSAQPVVIYPDPNGSTTVSLDEGPPVGRNLLTVTGTGVSSVAVAAVDTGTGGNKNSDFKVLGLTVQTAVPLDYETTATYTVTLTVKDAASKSVTVQFTLQVNGLPDETPAFDASKTYSVPFEEEQVIYSQVFPPFTITDGDTDDSHTFSIDGAHSSYFTVNPKTGAIIVNSQLDRDGGGPTLFNALVITVTDKGGNTATQSLTVTLVDINDNAPQCSPAVYTQYMAENTVASTPVVTLTCTDIDVTPNPNTISYDIISGDDTTNKKFQMSGNVVQTTSTPLDYETTTSYTLVIHAKDNGTPTKMTGSATVRVEVTSENDFTPVWATFVPVGPVITKSEDIAIGTTVVVISATDGDAGTDGEVTYSLLSVTDSANAAANGLLLLDQTTGVIKTNLLLDYDAGVTSYTFAVQAQDKGNPQRSMTFTLTLSLTDVNDNDPVFSPTSYSVTLTETNARAKSWPGPGGVQLAATDEETIPASLVYQITSGNTLDKFQLSSSTNGLLELKSAIDVDSPTQNPYVYYLTVQVSDQGHPGTTARTASATVTVSITDFTNDHPPEMDTPSPGTSITLDEAVSITTTVASFPAATDYDRDSGVAQSIVFAITGGNADGVFTIDTTTGTVTTAKTLDFETTSSYTLVVTAVDSGNPSKSASTTLSITVSNNNDNPPTCPSYSIIKYLQEGVAPPQVVASLACTDTDAGDTVEYTISPAVAGFTVDTTTGVVSTITALDYEASPTKTRTLKVEVKDTQAPSNTVTVTLTVSVVHVNEVAPVFSALSYSASVPEDAGPTSLVKVVATDTDQGGLDGTIRYSIMSGNGLGAFAIDETSGEVSVASAGLLDRESTATHTLIVKASDDSAGAATEKTANATVVITITDVNDNTPLCNPTSYQKTVVESAAVGATVATLTVRDDDKAGTAFATTTLIIDTGNSAGKFGVSGQNLVLANMLDYETETSYTLTLTVKDGGSTPLFSTCTVQITVLPSNEHSPTFAVPNHSETLPETKPVGHVVFTNKATDGDTGLGSSLTYSIIGGNTDNVFYCYTDAGAAKVVIWKRLDHDKPPQTYNLTVEAKDDAGLTGTFWLHITLTGSNDETPSFAKNTFNFDLYENVPVGTQAAVVTAVDADPLLDGTITYTAVSGNGVNYFAVDPGTGAITSTASLDRELFRDYHIVVKAEDGGSEHLSSTTLVVISLKDLNDNAPIFTPATFTVEVDETSVLGTSLTTVSADDADATVMNHKISYGLTNTLFEVHSSTGVVTNKMALDRETAASHEVVVTATDAGTNPATNVGSSTVTILINDVNDNSPDITGPFTARVWENDTASTIAATLTVTDADAGDNARLNYAITGGNDDDDFMISPVNGVIQVKNALDRERNNMYSLIIEVNDNGNPKLTSTATVNISIADINDNAPFFTSTSYSFTVRENKPVGENVGQVTARDRDVGDNAALTYSIVNFWTGNGAHLSIDGATGRLRTAAVLDREAIPEYTLLVRVTDGSDPFYSDDVNVTVAVTDQNDNAPVFDEASYANTTVEHDPVDTQVLVVTITDADIGVNDDITLSIDTSTTAGQRADTFFKVTFSSGIGVVTVKSDIDRETDTSFSFRLKAEDGGSTSLTTYASVTITVLDINDHSPIFTQIYYNMAMDYAGKCTKSIVTVTATDKDTGTNGEVSYFLKSSEHEDLFEVNAVTGQVSMEYRLSAGVLYLLTVSAQDRGTPTANTATIPVVIRVDSMIPNNVVVTYKLGIPVDAFATQQTVFLEQLQAVVRSQYPTAVAKLWCVETNSDGLADAHVYFLQDNSTEADKDTAKYYVPQETARAMFTSDTAGTPGTVLQGNEWSAFDIQAVHPYEETTTPWEQTTEGIAIITVASILGAVLLATAIYMFVRYCRRLRCRRPPPRKILIEEPPPPKDDFVEPIPRRVAEPQPEPPLSTYKGGHFWDTSFQT